MIEPYQWLATHASTLGIAHSAIGPASADLRLAGLLEEWRPLSEALRPSCRTHTLMMGDMVTLRPGRVYLASTVERLHVPPTHMAMLAMRHSFALRGLGQRMAGILHPGFDGHVTFALDTSLPLEVMIGERLVQITYHRLAEPTTQPYRGQCQGQRGPTEAYGVQRSPHGEICV